MERIVAAPNLPENLWGYGKRLRFVDDAIQRNFPGTSRSELSLLDVGCGNGSQLAIPLAAAGYQVTAVDPHQRSIERGRMLAPNVDFIHGAVTDIPQHFFDCVILSEVLEHLGTPEVLLRAALGYLSARGVLIVTVPNGYGEFELDRRIYFASGADKLFSWLHASFKKNEDIEYVAGSDDDSPHVQRFTLSRLRAMFTANHLQLIEQRGTSLASGPFVCHILGRFESFVHWNAAITDHLPLFFAAGWMFSLRSAHEIIR
jgi:2-polyprenyl-3-methyl-5-hydroxy-6-metoxy-1,4-benzoquinol methylase